MSRTLSKRFLALFKGSPPELQEGLEEGQLPFDPEWAELLSWAEVSRPATEMRGEDVSAEEQEWAEVIAAARLRGQPREEADRAEWAAAIPVATQSSESTEEAEWAAAIGRAKMVLGRAPGLPAMRQPTSRQVESNGNGAGASLRERIERLAARAGITTAPTPAGEQELGSSAEEAQWHAAIQRAKAGNA